MTRHLFRGRWLCPVRDSLGIEYYAVGTWGLLYNPHAWWVGLHYSEFNRRVCVNLLPCFTLWWAHPRGNEP